MPHVALVACSGLRVKEVEMQELGMSLPALQSRAVAISHLPSLGLLTLAGMTPSDWTQSYHEFDTSVQDVANEILSIDPTVVAMSALTASIGDAYRLANLLRQAGAPVVIGGLHATSCPEEAARYCNSVVVGEGEPVWLKLLDDARAGRLETRYERTAPFDLGHSPRPRFDLLPGGRRSRMTLQTQRGCPLSCDFCGASRLLGPFREKPLALIDRELESIKRRGSSRMIELADDNTFAGNRDHAGFCDVFRNHGVKYFTEADWRIASQPRLLENLAASGCVQVLVGVESLVHDHSGMGVKKASFRRIMDAIDVIQDHGIAVLGCFIVGSDGETPETIRRLGDLLLYCNLAEIQLTLLTPFPGTALFQQLKRQGRLLADRDWSHFTLFDVTFQPDKMEVHVLEEEFRGLVRKVFSDQASKRRLRIKRRIWTGGSPKCD